MVDFFITYNKADLKWAEWIAWELEAAGYKVKFQAWDSQPGMNFVVFMNQSAKEAERTVAVLSQAYVRALFTQPEWSAAFVQDPTGTRRKLIPVRVEDFEVEGLLKAIVYIDLVRLPENEARDRLLNGVKLERAKPDKAPIFPGSEKRTATPKPSFPGALPPNWNIPHLRNPNFTGREELLTNLREALTSEKTAAITQAQAIHGLGGVGKTQLATEYAYRFGSEYEIVWWMRSEEPTTLAADYATLASKLNLQERDTPDQSVVVAAVRNWLNHNGRWLLVFDNARQSQDIRSYLPQAKTGHIIITSRGTEWDEVVRPFKISRFERPESIDYLCGRTKDDDRKAADELAEEVGDLPLALAQAAGFIRSAKKSIRGYIELYREHKEELLSRETTSTDYPNTVATTWKISLDQAKAWYPLSEDLLRLSSFFSPDDISRKLLNDGLRRSSNADELAFDEALAALQENSLFEATTDSVSVHRLVQAVTRGEMPENDKKRYASIAIGLISATCSDLDAPPNDVRAWPFFATLLPHALVAVAEAEKNLVGPLEVASVVNYCGLYHYGRGNHSTAEPLYRRSLKIVEEQLGADHPITATNLNNLALLLQERGKYAEAEELHRRALRIRQKACGFDHPDVAKDLNNLALLLQGQGKYAGAEALHRQALEICEKQLGADHPDTATNLNNLALSLHAQAKYADAEPLYRRVLKLLEKSLGSDHPNVASGLCNLGELLHAQGKYAEAELLHRQALEIREERLGADHIDVAISLDNLAGLLRVEGKNGEAESLHRRALKIREKQLGDDHPLTATSLNNLALLLQSQERYAEAEPLHRSALKIREAKLGSSHPQVAQSMNNLALLLQEQGKCADAEVLHRRALEIDERAYGPDHPEVSTILNNLAELLRAQGKYIEAEPLYRRALNIDERAYEPEHPSVATDLNNLAELLRDQGKYAEAEPLYRRALGIMEGKVGENHPNTETVRQNLKSLKESLQRKGE